MRESLFWRYVLLLSLLALAFFLLIKLWGIVLPFFFGLVLAYMVHPAIDRFVSEGLRRDRIVLILYAALMAVMAVAVFYFFPVLLKQINIALAHIPVYAATFDTLINTLNKGLQDLFKPLLGHHAHVLAIPLKSSRFFEQLAHQLPDNITSVAHMSLWVVIVPFVAYFALTEGKNWIDQIFDWTPSIYVESLLGIIAEIDATLGGYIRGQILDGLCVGFTVYSGLMVIQLDGALLIGCMTALLNPIPFMGPLVGAGMAMIAGVMQGVGSSKLIVILFLFIAARLMDDFVFTPFIVGHSVRLHPILMLFSVLAGYELAGILGLIFAVPAAAVVKVILQSLLSRRQGRVVILSQPVV